MVKLGLFALTEPTFMQNTITAFQIFVGLKKSFEGPIFGNFEILNTWVLFVITYQGLVARAA